jgi:hypothetical protein
LDTVDKKAALATAASAPKDDVLPIHIPRPIPTAGNQQGIVLDENVNRILKFLYHN